MTAYSPTDGDVTARDSTDLPRDTVLELLSDRRRRLVLASVADAPRSTVIPLAELTQDVAVLEHGTPRAAIPDEDVQSIETSLHHHHLPKLADADVVEYDHDRAEVRATGGMDRIDRVLAPPGSETLGEHRWQITFEEN